MKNAPLRALRLAALGTFLAIVASPPASPRLAPESSPAPLQLGQPSCPDSLGAGLAYDGDTQRCLRGGDGCDHYQ